MADTQLVPTKVLSDTNKGVESLAVQAASLTVASPEQVKEADTILHAIKMWKQTITGRKEEITRPQMAALKSVRDMFAPAEETLTEAEKTVKAKKLEYKKLEEKAAEENPGATVTKQATRKLPRVRIVDESLIPREYLTADVKKITEAVLREGKVIPGCEKYVEEIIVN